MMAPTDTQLSVVFDGLPDDVPYSQNVSRAPIFKDFAKISSTNFCQKSKTDIQ